MSLNRHFDGIYCLNLPSSKDRRMHMEAEFNKFNCNVNFVSGISPCDTEFNEAKVKYFDPSFKPRCFCIGRCVHIARPMRECEVAICLSHLKIYREIIKNNHRISMIIEDDVIFHRDIYNIINDLYKRGLKEILSQDYPVIVFCGGNNNPGLKIQGPEKYQYQLTKDGCYSNYCCIINLSAIKILEKNAIPITRPDDSYRRYLVNIGSIAGYQITPSLVGELSEGINVPSVYSRLSKQVSRHDIQKTLNRSRKCHVIPYTINLIEKIIDADYTDNFSRMNTQLLLPSTDATDAIGSTNTIGFTGTTIATDASHNIHNQSYNNYYDNSHKNDEVNLSLYDNDINNNSFDRFTSSSNRYNVRNVPNRRSTEHNIVQIPSYSKHDLNVEPSAVHEQGYLINDTENMSLADRYTFSVPIQNNKIVFPNINNKKQSKTTKKTDIKLLEYNKPDDDVVSLKRVQSSRLKGKLQPISNKTTQQSKTIQQSNKPVKTQPSKLSKTSNTSKVPNIPSTLPKTQLPKTTKAKEKTQTQAKPKEKAKTKAKTKAKEQSKKKIKAPK